MDTLTATAARAETPALDADRERLEHLTQRRSALAAGLDAANKRVTAAQAARDAAIAGLAEGQGEQAGVEKADRTLTLARAGVEHLSAALRSVESESQLAAGRVRDAEARIESARQEREAAPLRAECDRLVELFVKSAAGIAEPLERRAKLAAEIRSRFPRAAQVQPVRLDALAGSVVKALRLPDSESLLAAVFLLRVLGGPAAASGPRPGIAPERLRALHIDGGR